MLHINGITYRVGGRTLFEDASAQVSEGQRVGLVGRNGSGKTTLLRLIEGRLELDGGRIDVRARARIGAVAQEAPRGSHTPLAEVLAADRERAALLAEAEVARDPARIAEIHTRLVDIDAHAAPARAAAILAGLGFDEAAQGRPIDSLSGGWRMRVALAAALFAEPDLLLLDEPTNHLDLESTIWLESYLAAYPHTLLMVSHDRELLNRVVERILHVERGRLIGYAGGYDAFVRVQAEQRALAEATAARQEAERKRMEAFVARFKAKASKARQAQSRVKLLKRMTPIAVLAVERKVRFDFPAPLAQASPLIKLDGAAVGYGDGPPVLADLHLSLFAEDRVALLGANGNGKTTLARLLAGQLAARAGQVVRAGKLKVAYFAQDQLEQLDPRLTALEQLRREMPEAAPDAVRGWLGRFGFEQQRAEVPVAGLSGGERTRLVLALLAQQRPNLMILDEPTNHLDVEAREALIIGLAEFAGAIVLISHDRYLVEASADQLWRVAGGTCTAYFGDIDEYRAELLGQRRAERAAPARETDPESSRESRRDARRRAAEARARVAPLKQAARAAEARLEELQAEKDAVEAALADPAVYEGPGEQVAELSRRQRELSAALTAAEEQWLAAHAELEQAEAVEDADAE